MPPHSYPAPQIRRVSRRHCALYKLNLLTYLLTYNDSNSHLVPGTDVYFVELVGKQVVNGKYQLMCLNVETHYCIVGQSRLKQFLQ